MNDPKPEEIKRIPVQNVKRIWTALCSVCGHKFSIDHNRPFTGYCGDTCEGIADD